MGNIEKICCWGLFWSLLEVGKWDITCCIAQIIFSASVLSFRHTFHTAQERVHSFRHQILEKFIAKAFLRDRMPQRQLSWVAFVFGYGEKRCILLLRKGHSGMRAVVVQRSPTAPVLRRTQGVYSALCSVQTLFEPRPSSALVIFMTGNPAAHVHLLSLRANLHWDVASWPGEVVDERWWADGTRRAPAGSKPFEWQLLFWG